MSQDPSAEERGKQGEQGEGNPQTSEARPDEQDQPPSKPTNQRREGDRLSGGSNDDSGDDGQPLGGRDDGVGGGSQVPTEPTKGAPYGMFLVMTALLAVVIIFGTAMQEVKWDPQTPAPMIAAMTAAFSPS